MSNHLEEGNLLHTQSKLINPSTPLKWCGAAAIAMLVVGRLVLFCVTGKVQKRKTQPLAVYRPITTIYNGLQSKKEIRFQ